MDTSAYYALADRREGNHGVARAIAGQLADERDGRAILVRYADKTFSLPDAISFAVMDRLHLADAFTFDLHFAQYGKRILATPPA